MSQPLYLDVLKTVKAWVKNHKKKLEQALFQDLGKSPTESHLTEISLVLKELDLFLKKAPSWSMATKIKTPWMFYPAQTWLHREPYGKVLIFSPWNYPVQLALLPAIGALGSQNPHVTVKLSEWTPHVNEVLATLGTDPLVSQSLTFVQGDQEVCHELLEQSWDLIFFTGSPKIGKIVAEKAGRALTPVVLELGGKSPLVVDLPKEYLEVAVKRILWAKFINCGQTCIAPDYLLIRQDLKDLFLSLSQKTLQTFFGKNPQLSSDYGRIISESHLARLSKLLEGQTILLGGRSEDRFLEPTYVDNPSWDSPLMTEEIFGPILPILTFPKKGDFLEILKSKPKPLAFYFYSLDPEWIQKTTTELSFGSGVINDSLIQGGMQTIPFGGVGSSGMGAYHGRTSFETFSRVKPVIHQSLKIDPWIRYPPYGGLKRWLLSLF